MLGKTIEIEEDGYAILIPVSKISFVRKGPKMGAGPNEGRNCLEIWTVFPDRPVYVFDPKEIERVWENFLSQE